LTKKEILRFKSNRFTGVTALAEKGLKSLLLSSSQFQTNRFSGATALFVSGVTALAEK
jgi:hypothetical protein